MLKFIQFASTKSAILVPQETATGNEPVTFHPFTNAATR